VKLKSALVAVPAGLIVIAGLTSPAYAAPRAADALKVDKCSLHVNIPHPTAGQRETLTAITTVGKTTVVVKIKYKTVSHNWTLKTAANKKATHAFGVGRPTPNYKVTLSGKVTAVPKGYKTGATCATSFVPK